MAVRPVPHRTDELVDVAVSVGAQRLHLDPLDTAAVGELAGRVVDATPGPALLRLVEGARGNPFFVIELVRALREERAIDVDDDGVAEARITGMPPTLRQTILRRLRALSPTALELLRGAAVLGGEFDVDDLAALLDRPAVSLHADLVAAVESGLLEEAGPRLRVRHDLIREAVHADLPEAIRVSLHRRAATVLNERGQPAIVVASHLLAAGRSGADAVAVLRRAGAELEDRDPAGALAMLDDALAVDGIDGRERLDVLADRVPLLVALGRLGDAERAAREALRANRDAEVEARLRLGLAESQLAAGFATGAVEQLETVRASGVLDEEQQAVLLADTAWARLDVFDLEGSARDARSAADWARAHDAPPVLSSALAIQSRLAAYAADFERAVGLGEEAVRVAGDDRAVVRRTPRLFLGLALVNADRADDAVATLAEGRRRAEDAGVPWAVASYHNALILSGFHTGAWDDATAEAEAARALHAEAGTRAGYLQMESMLGLMWLHLAEYDRARDALTRAEADFAEPGHDAGGIIWLLWLQASLAELDGDPDEALRLLGAAFDFAQQLRVHSVKLWYGPELVRLALAAGDRDRATAVAGSVEEAAQPASTATARGAASLCGGLVTGDPGRLLAAVAAYRQTPRRPDLV
ncbi:MAG: ATP-binding protein, partial [Acidimicrobiia bacterium]